MDRLLRLKSVIDLTGLSRSRVYELIAVGAFPAPVKIGVRAVAWRASEIAAYRKTRPRMLACCRLRGVAR